MRIQGAIHFIRACAADRLKRHESITWEELEEGLLMLHRLHSKGLITDHEYNAKKKELLDAVGPGK